MGRDAAGDEQLVRGLTHGEVPRRGAVEAADGDGEGLVPAGPGVADDLRWAQAVFALHAGLGLRGVAIAPHEGIHALRVGRLAGVDDLEPRAVGEARDEELAGIGERGAERDLVPLAEDFFNIRLAGDGAGDFRDVAVACAGRVGRGGALAVEEVPAPGVAGDVRVAGSIDEEVAAVVGLVAAELGAGVELAVALGWVKLKRASMFALGNLNLVGWVSRICEPRQVTSSPMRTTAWYPRK